MEKNENISLIILEDEIAHLRGIKRALTLTGNGYEISTATTLKEFNQVISNITPDIVIADINLPDGSAFSILQGEVEDHHWPVVVMTSYGDEEIAVKAIKSGALDYIVKSPDAFKNIEHVIKRNLREWYNIQKSRENEDKFRSLFETMAQGVIYQDISGKIIGGNSAAEKIFGLTMDLMQNRTLFDLGWEAIHEDGSVCPEELHPAMIALRTGLPVKDNIMGIQHLKEGDYRWLLVSSIPQFRENEKKARQVFTTFTDITELKKAKEKAEESDRLKSAFIANLSHEIRTPMNGILGFADLLNTPNLSEESQKVYIDAISSSGKRMLDIIFDLIDISKLESGQMEIKIDIVDISKVLDELFIFFLPEANKKGVMLKFKKELSDDNILVETDRTKLMQILTNLIKNALKFTSRGYVEFGCEIEGNNYLFYVKDTGIGVKKEFHDQIFERFRQGDVTPSGIYEGTGLGLAISKAYVELLGGKISIESEPSKGSLFSFTIPFKELKPGKSSVVIKDEKSEPTAISSIGDSIPCSTILIADDDDSIYFYLQQVLKLNNLETLHARDGLEAVEVIKSNSNIDLILMDIKMPRMDGLEATRQIRAIKSRIPIIAQSAFNNEVDISNAFEAGCNDYISKPFNRENLINKIVEHCSS